MASTPKYDDSSIKQMTQLEHIRAKYSMYIGAADLDADCQLLKEICDNSFDEVLSNTVSTIKIIFFAQGDRYQVAIVDHGRGIPCQKLKQIYTEAYTSGKYSSQAYNAISIGSYGIGSKCVSALSRRFTAFSKRMDGFAGLIVEKGIVKSSEVTKPIDKNESTVGTTVIYEVDQTILKESAKYMTDERGLQRTLKYFEYVCAFKQNAKVEVYKVNKLLPEAWFKQSFQDMWAYLQSCTGDLIYKTPENITPFEYSKSQNNISGNTVWKLSLRKDIDPTNDLDTTGYFLEVGLVKDCEKQFGLLATVNSNPIGNYTSSHIAVMMDRLKKRIRQYIDEDDKELQLFFDTKYDIPLHGYICAFYKNASYINQTKDGFKDTDFARVYGQSLDRQFNKEPDETWEQLYDLIVDDLEHKFLAVTSKTLQTGKNLKNAAFKISRIGSYISCAVNNPEVTELLITEGNSAGDFAKQKRDENFQAILKLRGKPINAITASSDDLRSNAVYQDMIRLFGVGPRDTDLRNFNYKSVGLLADADPDGYHILTLLIGCIYKINPLILESGKVWIANPPLYVHETKDKVLYLRDQKALDDARVQLYDNFFDFHLLNTISGNSVLLKNSSYRDFVYLVKRIGSVINNISRKLVTDPFVLEQLVHVVDYLTPSPKNCEMIRKILNLESCTYHEIANSLLLVDDGAEISIPLSRLEQEIRAYILPELQPIHWKQVKPLVTTKKTDCYMKTPLTYMQINKIFEDIDKAYPVRRIKGLGECEPEQLKYSCLDPATRTYTTITSIGDVDKLFQMLGVDTSYRKELAKTDAARLIGDML
ncbi:MAG: ATP-binding protein [Clostridia bacterium]|nr:ATP-binding protein [Clostridia bacterium]